MRLTRRGLLVAGSAAVASAAFSRTVFGQGNQTIRIGLLTDMSGPYRDLTGPNSVICQQMAIDEFVAANPDFKIELLSADHQNKPDVAVGIARQWIDQEGVDCLSNVTTSSVALAVNGIAAEKDKVHLNTGAGTSLLTGAECKRTTVHWPLDSWNLATAAGVNVTNLGSKSWFFFTPNYAYGQSLQEDATKAIQKAGGTVAGAVVFPFPETSDFSSYLAQAQASGADTFAFGVGGTFLINFMKQAQEFGLRGGNIRFVSLTSYVTDIIAMGLPVAQDLIVSENFYWDLNDRTRAFYERVKPRLPAGVFPCVNHASDYAAVSHFLKAVKEMGVAEAKKSGTGIVDMMKKMPTDDDCFGQGTIREDGRKLHPSYTFRVKKPEESKGPGDVYEQIASLPADTAFRPLSEGACPFIKA